MMRIFTIPLLLLLLSSIVLHAQKDTWVEANEGFAKCPSIGQSAGEANWERDDFNVKQMIHLRGEMYASITYGLNGLNTSSCNAGFFRHDTLTNKWIKVAEAPVSDFLVSNGTSVFCLFDGWVYEFTTNYALYPDGWRKSLTQLKQTAPSPCGNSFNGFHFSRPGEAIGDTIYVFMDATSDLYLTCWNYNQVGKYSILTDSWTFERLGPFPHQMAGETYRWGYSMAFADHIGGIFKYFLSYDRWGGDKCIPNYLWVWDPRSKQWENISQGVNWRNMTGNSNPESCVSPEKPPINWGPSGGWTTSWDKRDVYVTSETGVYRWEGDKFYYIADYWGNSHIYPTNNGIFTTTMGQTFKMNPTTYVPVGKLYDYDCVHNQQRLLTSPDNGKTLYVLKEGMKDPQICTYSSSRSAQLGIYRLTFDPDKPAKARNLHVQTATYLGGPGDNTPVNTGVAGKHHVFVAGNFSQVQSPLSFIVNNFNSAGPSSRGRVIHMNTFGDTILSVANLGNVVYDYEVQNFGKYRMVVSGDFGVSVLDSSSMNQLWNISTAQLWGSGEINVDIDDKGHVVVLRNKQFKVFDANGVSISDLITLTDNFVNDITIKNDTVYVVGFNNGTLNGDDCIGNAGGSGLPVQSSFVKAYALFAGSLNFMFKTFGHPGSLLGKDEADTRGYRINIGKDGKVYFLGEAAGGNSVFRWNGKETIQTNGCQNPKSTLISYDVNSIPFNTKDAHIAYFCTINPKNGDVERGQYIIPRLPAGVSNSYRIKEGYIHADQKGYVYIGATSAYQFGGRDIQHLNGILVDEYAGGDMVVLVVNPDYTVRTFWGTFSKEKGSGTIKGFGIRDNIISAIGETGQGKMITGGTLSGSFNEGNALHSQPFNLDMTGDVTPLNDTYLAVWYQDIWNHAPSDTLEERKNDSNPVIDEEAANYRANFEADVTTVCVGGSVTFTNTSVGDSTNWLWDFGNGSSLAKNTFGEGPFTVQYTTPGLKTIRLDVLLKGKVNDYTLKYHYINVMPADQTLPAIEGATLACSGTHTFYRIEAVYGIKEYIWTVPSGAIILQGQGSSSIEVSWGTTAGNVTVVGKTPCGETPMQTLPIDILSISENSVLLVVGNTTLDAGDLAIKNKLESLGYEVNVIEDAQTNPAHGECAALIIISGSADPEKVNYKFLHASVPIITYQPSLFDNLGMTVGDSPTAQGTEASQAISIVDATHELGKDVGPGNVNVYSSAQNVNWGNPSSEGIIIATVNGKASIIGYEQGSTMFGLDAPARRVAFFMSQQGASILTPGVGDKLLDQAICWTMYNCPTTVTITTQPLATATYCPGSEIAIPFTITGTFNTGSIVPPPQNIIMDDVSTGVSIQGLWARTTDIDGTPVPQFRKHDPIEGKGDFAKYNPTILYTGTYKVSINFPRHTSFASNVKVDIIHAHGKDTQTIEQKSGSGPIDLGTYTFQEGKSGYVLLKVEGATGIVVTDMVTFESVLLSPLGGNIFTAQLSDREGSFAVPVSIGSLEGTTEGTITGTIPDDALPGTAYKVRVVSSNPSFKGTPSSTTITIDGIPANPLHIKGEALACSGSTIQSYEVDPVVAGATGYVWDIPLGTHFIDFPNVTTVTTDATIDIDFGTGTSNEIKVYANNACGKSKEPARLLVEMTGLPPAKPSAISGNTIICPSTQQTYSIAPVEFASHYIWTLSSGLSGSSETNSITVDFGSTGPATISVRAVGACGEGEATNVIITVNEDCNAAVANFSAVTTTCTNTPVIFTDLSVNATSWSWNFGDGAVPQSISGFGPAKTPPPIIYTTEGTKTVSLTINIGTPFEKIVESDIIVSPKAGLPSIIAGGAIACGGAAVEYSVPDVPHADSYVWTLPDNATGSSITKNIMVSFGPLANGFVTVAGVNAACGSGPESSYFVRVNNETAKPDAITGPIEVCADAEGIEYLVPEVMGATKYIWTLSGDATGTSESPSILVDFGTAIPTTIGVKATNGCTISDEVSLPVTVNPGSATLTAVIAGPSAICAGAMEVPYSIPPVISALSYTWVLPGSATGTSTSNTIAVNFASALTGSIRVSALLSCGASSQVELPIEVEDGLSTPPDIDGLAAVCANQNDVVYTASLDGVEEYQWTLPAGASGSSSGNFISIDFGATVQGDISVSGLYACGVGAPAKLTISTLPSNPLLGNIDGPSRLCANETDAVYTITPLDGVTEYVWSLPSGATGTSITNSINVDFSNGIAGEISVQGKTGCGLTAVSKLPVELISNGLTGTLTGTATICPGTLQQTYNVSGLPEALFYTWVVPDAATGNSTTSSIILDFSDDIASSELTAIANMECGDPVQLILPITVPEAPGVPGSISGNPYVCKNSSATYSIEPVPEVTSYRWILPDGANTPDVINSNSITVIFGKELFGDLCVVAEGACKETEPVCLPVTLNTEAKGLCEIFIPNAFSPNGDGSNDVWQISGLGNFQKARVQVFNRWGTLVYNVEHYEVAWDGTANGKKLPTATYYYIINLDNEEPRKGSVSIIRD